MAACTGERWRSKLPAHALFTKLRENLEFEPRGSGRKPAKNLTFCLDGDLFVWDGAESAFYTTNLRQLNSTDLVPEQYQKGVSVLELPQRWGKRSEFEGGRCTVNCKTIPVAERFFTSSGSLTLRQAAWYPSETEELHLVLLTSDNSLRCYSLKEPQTPARSLSLSQPEEESAVRTRGRSYAASLGEIAVAFDFGPRLPAPKQLLGQRAREDVLAYPLYILYENGETFLSYVSLAQSGGSLGKPVGPLPMHPAAEDNYGYDACAVLCLPCVPNILVIATESGTLYHCVVLEGEEEEDPALSDRWPQGAVLVPSLYVFECVELELTLKLAASEDGEEPLESDFTCPIRLHRDPLFQTRYHCTHEAGVHSVGLTWFSKLHKFLQSDEEDKDGLQELAAEQRCIVEHILCTRPLTCSAAAPVQGFWIVSDLSLGATMICITSSSDCITQPLLSATRSPSPPLLCSRPGLEFGSSPLRGFAEDSFEQHIRNILQRGSANPLLLRQVSFKSPSSFQLLNPVLTFSRLVITSGDKDVSPPPPECLQLLSRATQVFRDEYILKQDLAREEIQRRVKLLCGQKDKQLEDMAHCREERMKQILGSFRSQLPVLSDSEKDMRKELLTINDQLRHLGNSIKQVNMKKEYQQKQMEKGVSLPLLLQRAERPATLHYTLTKVNKMKQILGSFRSQLPVLSDSEKDMRKELLTINDQLRHLGNSIKQVNMKKEYQQKQMEKGVSLPKANLSLTAHQRTCVFGILKEEAAIDYTELQTALLDQNVATIPAMAQEDAEKLRSVVMPMESEIAALKAKLTEAEDRVKELEASKVKELNHVLEAEKSCRTDLEMYVAVLNTQKSVLQEDSEKLRKELHEVCHLLELERQQHNQLKHTWQRANDQFLESQRLLMRDMQRIESVLSSEQLRQVEEIKKRDQLSSGAFLLTKDQEKAIKAMTPEQEETASLLSSISQAPENAYLPASGYRLVSECEWNLLQQEVKNAGRKLGRRCDMCSNYEKQLQVIQCQEAETRDQVKKLQVMLRQANDQLERTLKDKQELEECVKQGNEETTTKVSTLMQRVQESETLLTTLQQAFSQAKRRAQEQMALLMQSREQVAEELASLQRDNESLQGKHRLHLTLQQQENFTMPTAAEELQALVLRYREDLVCMRTEADHLEEKLKAEILFLKEQIQAEQCLKENLEETLQLEIDSCKEEIASFSSLKTELERVKSEKEQTHGAFTNVHTDVDGVWPKGKTFVCCCNVSFPPCVKCEGCSDFSPQFQWSCVLFLQLQSSLAEKTQQLESLHGLNSSLEEQLRKETSTKTSLEGQVYEEKDKAQRLQMELDVSEQVQRDFVKLSQTLQVHHHLSVLVQSDVLHHNSATHVCFCISHLANVFIVGMHYLIPITDVPYQQRFR
ncbi:UNVERIFIED_CONTAM: hypothetical protein FKN15_012514 [Acipenser sinensis]